MISSLPRLLRNVSPDLSRETGPHRPLLFLLVLLPLSAWGAPKLEVSSSTVDLGKLDRQGNVQKKTVSIKNTGMDPLDLRFQNSSCGCCYVDKYDKSIPAKSTGTIVLAVDPKQSARGQQKQVLLFSTSDPTNRQFPLYVSWSTNLGEVAVSPEQVILNLSKKEVRKSSPRTRVTVFVIDAWKTRLAIRDIQTSPHLITSFFDMVYRCPKGVETHIMRFEANILPDTPVGPMDEWIKFSTNHPQYPHFVIPIKGSISSDVRVQPKVLVFRDIVRGQHATSKNVQIEATESKSRVQVREIRTSAPWVRAETIRVTSSRTDVRIFLNEAALPAGRRAQEAEVTVVMQEPEVFEEKIDVAVLPRIRE